MSDNAFKRFVTADKMVYHIPAENFSRDMIIYNESMLGDGIAARKLLEGETGWWYSGLDAMMNGATDETN